MNRDDRLCWYHKSLARDEAEDLLKNGKLFATQKWITHQTSIVEYDWFLFFLISEGKGDGIFLVRDSNTSPGDYVLSVLHNVSDKTI